MILLEFHRLPLEKPGFPLRYRQLTQPKPDAHPIMLSMNALLQRSTGGYLLSSSHFFQLNYVSKEFPHVFTTSIAGFASRFSVFLLEK